MQIKLCQNGCGPALSRPSDPTCLENFRRSKGPLFINLFKAISPFPRKNRRDPDMSQ